MLMPDYFYGKSVRMTQLYDKLQEWILRDIARRILAAGEMTATADRMLWKLEQMGLHRAEVMKRLAALMAATEDEMRELLQDAVLTSWADDAETWDSLGVHLSNPLENPEVVTVMDAEYKKSLGSMERLTRTTMDQSQQDLIRLLDDAELRVSSGMQSYDAAARSVLDDYAGKGTIVTYPTGARLTVEAAVRLNVVTSMNQTAGQVSNQYIKEVGTNYVLISAHYGARVKRPDQPDLAGHDLWQGRVFCIQGEESGIPNLLESTGYAIEPGLGIGAVVNPLGLHGYNCRHSHKPWDKSLRNPWRDENGNLLDGNGDIITPEKNEEIYHKRGRQRAIEREIRKTKRQMIVKEEEIKAAGSETEKEYLTEEYSRMDERLTQLNKTYNDYCSANDLQPDYARNYVSKTGNNKWTANKGIIISKEANNLREPLDVSKIYLRSAHPGMGKIIKEDGYDRGLHTNELAFSEWLLNTFGGNIVLQKESSIDGVRRADYSWNNLQWDLKDVTTEKAANSAVRSGVGQIRSNPGGIFLNYTNYNPDIEVLKKVIKKRMDWVPNTERIDIMVIVDGHHVVTWRFLPK